MATPAMGKRSWICPECQQEVELSIAQLDPLACENCMAQRRQPPAAAPASGPSVLSGLPEVIKLGAAGALGLFVGLLLGFAVGRFTAPQPAPSAGPNAVANEEVDEPPPPPRPGYRWNKGRTHKDGTRGKGFWSKDPNYKGDTNE